MGLIHAQITLSNPQHIALQLEEKEQRLITTADGRTQSVPCVGPAGVHFGNRNSDAGARVIGDEPLPGAIQTEDMDLVLHPLRGTITVHPEHPNFAVNIVI